LGEEDVKEEVEEGVEGIERALREEASVHRKRILTRLEGYMIRFHMRFHQNHKSDNI